jgi:hypothetical protein
MNFRKLAALLASFAMVCPGAAHAQRDPNPAMNNPDQFAWTMFLQVNTPASGTNALFETWASDTDTFKMQPSFPVTAHPLALHAPAVPAAGRRALQAAGHVLPQLPPGAPNQMEETRRNRAAFDFIVQNGLYKVSTLRASFGKSLSFPVDAVEIKANWIPIADVPGFTLKRVSVADAPKFFHVNTTADGQAFALVGMHIITKGVPNWTWATFENEANPGRCDILGCRDNFGAPSTVAANPQQNKGYPPCVKTAALVALFATAHLDPAFAHYCLKGSQSDFTDNSGLAFRLGNSVAEQGFVAQSSCITCHGRAAWNKAGADASPGGAGFDQNGAPMGPISPSWYWSFAGKPPIFQGMPGLTQVATSADFVWSIPFCAVDDTVSPPKLNPNCIGK